MSDIAYRKSFSSFRLRKAFSRCLLSPSASSTCFLIDKFWSCAAAKRDLSSLICSRHVWNAPWMAVKVLSTNDGEWDLPRLADLDGDRSRRGDFESERLILTVLVVCPSSTEKSSIRSQWLTTSWAILLRPSSIDSVCSSRFCLVVSPSVSSRVVASLPTRWSRSSKVVTDFSRVVTILSLSTIWVFSLSFTIFSSLFLKRNTVRSVPGLGWEWGSIHGLTVCNVM